jgi:hypothetical protein
MRTVLLVVIAGLMLSVTATAVAGMATSAARETAEYVLQKFGRGTAGQTVEEVTDSTARAIARHGDEVVPLVRHAGHGGLAALEQAGDQAPEVIRLFARKGDEAVWLISERGKLRLFLKHGDSAADALIKHPGIADDLIGRFGNDAVGALNSVSKRGAQRMAIAAEEGVFSATRRSAELLSVVRRYGDGAMDFIWRNKGALTVATLLGTFLADPEAYVSGAKQLVVDPMLAPIVRSTNWTWIVGGLLVVLCLPVIAGRLARARLEWQRSKKAAM